MLAFKSLELKASINLKYFKSKQEKANKHYSLFDFTSQIPNFMTSPNVCKYKLDAKFEGGAAVCVSNLLLQAVLLYFDYIWVAVS